MSRSGSNGSKGGAIPLNDPARGGLENYAPYLMNRIAGRYNASLRSEMSKLGLTTAQMRSIAVLNVHDGIMIRELSVYAVVEQSTLSRALDKLEAEAMIERLPDETDNRATRVHLTDKGREAYHRLWPHMRTAVDRMFAGIDEDEQRAFLGTLRKMLRNVRQHDF